MIDALSPDELLFEVLTPLGFRVRVTRSYWELIITIKHPAMAGRENDVRTRFKAQAKYGKVKAIWMCTYSTSRNVSGAGFVLLPSGLITKVF